MFDHNLEKSYSLSRGRPRYSSALDSPAPPALPLLELMPFQRPPALGFPKSLGRAFPCKALKSFYLRCRRRFLPCKPPSQRQLLCRQKILPAAGSLSVQSLQPKKRKTVMMCPPPRNGRTFSSRLYHKKSRVANARGSYEYGLTPSLRPDKHKTAEKFIGSSSLPGYVAQPNPGFIPPGRQRNLDDFIAQQQHVNPLHAPVEHKRRDGAK